MKFPLTVCVFLLTVCLSANITVTGTERGRVDITCPYAEREKYSYKYFYKGVYSNRTITLESDGIETFAMNGRFSLKDNHQTRSFTVTISGLRMEDAGPYGCKAGYGFENYNQIQLNVIRAPETTRPVQISTSTIRPITTTSPDHTSTGLASVAGGLVSVLLVLTVCSGAFLILKKRKRKSGTAKNVQQNMETDCMFEIPNTDFTVATSSSNQTPASHLNNDYTVYPTVTNQQPDSTPVTPTRPIR